MHSQYEFTPAPRHFASAFASMPVGGTEGAMITVVSSVLGTISVSVLGTTTVVSVGAGAIDGEFNGIAAGVSVLFPLVSPVAGP